MSENLYELMIRSGGTINFSPANEVEEILQNVLTICTTAKYSVPMDREFGIDGKLIDEPINSVRAKYTQEIVKAVRKFEPRAQISKVAFADNKDRELLYPQVWIRVVEAGSDTEI